jgi:hypothetical protein
MLGFIVIFEELVYTALPWCLNTFQDTIEEFTNAKELILSHR